MSLPTEEYALHCPSLDELSEVIKNGISKNFAKFEVSVVDCPDLSSDSWKLAASGLGGDPILIELGSPSNLCYPSTHDVVFSFNDVAKSVSRERGYFLGAGAASYRIIGQNGELMPNFNLSTGCIRSKSGKVIENDRPLQEDYSSLEVGPLCNLLGCDGTPGPVIRVWAQHRIGEHDFGHCIRRSMSEHYDAQQRVVGVGGVFAVRSGTIMAHVMPDFSNTPLHSDELVQSWLRWYSMHAPLVCMSTLLSSEHGTDFRLEHTHFFSDHGDAGHYHYDTTPENVEYEGFFVPCNRIYRVARP